MLLLAFNVAEQHITNVACLCWLSYPALNRNGRKNHRQVKRNDFGRLAPRAQNDFKRQADIRETVIPMNRLNQACRRTG